MSGLRVWLVFLGICSLAACARPTREWQASDHDEEPGTQPAVGAKKGEPAAAQGGTDLVEATWTSTCAVCHGAFGKGDGPNGPMVKAPDLTQSTRTDAELAATITSGKGKMPAFTALPPAVVSGLVKKIRSLKAP